MYGPRKRASAGLAVFIMPSWPRLSYILTRHLPMGTRNSQGRVSRALTHDGRLAYSRQRPGECTLCLPRFLSISKANINQPVTLTRGDGRLQYGPRSTLCGQIPFYFPLSAPQLPANFPKVPAPFARPLAHWQRQPFLHLPPHRPILGPRSRKKQTIRACIRPCSLPLRVHPFRRGRRTRSHPLKRPTLTP